MGIAMTVIVSFCLPKASGSASGIHLIRKSVVVAVGASTTEAVQPGEFVIVGNTETGMITVAADLPGNNPDAATMGIAVPSGGVSYPMFPRAGSIVNVKALA